MPKEPRQPKQKLSSELKDQDLSLSPAIGNTLVVGSQSQTPYKEMSNNCTHQQMLDAIMESNIIVHV